MRELVQNGKAPFQRANAGVSDFLNVCTYVGGEAIGQPEQWKPILASLQTELKRARVHGLLQQELDDVKKEMLASAEQAAKTEATQDMHNFLGRMNGDVARGRKPMSAQQRLELLNALMPGIALEEVSKSFASYFDGQNVLYMLELPEKEGLPVPTDAEFLAAAKEAEGVDVQPWAAKERPTSLMEQEPAPGKIASQEEDADLKIRSVTFENGVHAHFRSMDFKKNQAWCRILIGGGLIQETAANRGASDVAALAFQQTATRKLDSTTVRDLMTGKNVNVGGGAGRDHFALTVSGEPKDFEEGLRLAYLLLTEPKIEDSALKVWKERTLQSLEQLKTNVRGQMGLKFRQELYDNDPRFDVLSPERVDALSAAEAQAWLEGILKSGFVEVAFVGDMPLERMVELAARYLGALPKRDAKANHLDDLRKKDFPAGAQVATVEVKTITDRAEAVFGWRTPDERSVHEFRMIEAASMILRGRLREEIRENKSLTYSIGSFADSSSMFFDGGLLGTVFSADPAKVEEATKLSKEVILKFAAEGPTDEELETTHKQFKTELDKNYEEPGTWVSILGDLDFHGNKLEYVKQHIAEMSTFTKDALMAVVKKYLVEDRYRQVIATPVK
ncbi:MAG: insulinase family protein [Planctomycetota bacterium]|nr:insulinase family protein [Planctomycetota bacterium]